MARPDGTEGYTDLIRNAVVVEYAGVRVAIASLDDLIRMARGTAAASPRRSDQEARKFAILVALRQEIDTPMVPEISLPPPMVHVRAHQRRDGTIVPEHWRRAARHASTSTPDILPGGVEQQPGMAKKRRRSLRPKRET